MIKIIAWNISRRDEAWHYLLQTDADIALLSEAASPPTDVSSQLECDSALWQTAGAGQNRPWRTVVVKLSNRVKVQWIEIKSVANAKPGELAVSRSGTLAAAIITPRKGDSFVVAAMYAPWEKPHTITGSSWIYADGSAHRIISDLSTLIGQQSRHRILAAGDLNILYGYGEGGNAYWASRYSSVFERMEALGLTFVGPQAPAGRSADPWPDELPANSANIPTFYSSNQTPATASRQLDFVFASTDWAKNVQTRALNEVNHWGPSDHCRIEIDINS